MAVHGVWLTGCGNCWHKIFAINEEMKMKILSNFKIEKTAELENVEVNEGRTLKPIEEKDLEFISGGGEWSCSNWSCSYSW